ncbi:MAG TPA: glycosyltransferase [Candidatus Paceibacterota bacterium]|nr:glycosyltransferase [Candidatus Paceibacterota bacterium]
MELSIVIPAYNEAKYIGATIESVIKHGNGVCKEIIVVDNGSSDSTSAVAAAYPNVKVVREEQKGTSHARERGFREASGDVIGFIDADTRLRPGWTRRVARRFEDPTVACISGPYWYYDLSAPMAALVIFLNWYIAYPVFLFINTFVIGGNFAIRRSVLEQMGGFDTSISFHGDDVDVGRRASAFGRVIPVPGMVLDSSARRFRARGTLRTLALYAYNAIKGLVLRNPNYTEGYDEVR